MTDSARSFVRLQVVMLYHLFIRIMIWMRRLMRLLDFSELESMREFSLPGHPAGMSSILVSTFRGFSFLVLSV